MKQEKMEEGVVEKKFYEKVFKKQEDVTKKREEILRNMFKEDFKKEEEDEANKITNLLFSYCEKEGEISEAYRLINEDFIFFKEILGIIKERSGLNTVLSVEAEKVREDIEKKEKDIEKKVILQKRVVADFLREKIKYKARLLKYEGLIREVAMRKKFNVLNNSAVEDLEKEKEVGQKLVDMVMSKRIKLTVDYGNMMKKLVK